ncbi:hypothetical protein AGMMS49992_23440 [Clostridia bacterium]|nr:hypothetical protein AGMMS49992_23440 [Clostridia bacterium]
MIHILSYIDGDWVLQGGDYEFARWVIDNKGIIDVSKACTIGGKIVFTSGLLKDYQGSIKRIDKHRGNALLEVMLGKTPFRIWVAFDRENLKVL